VVDFANCELLFFLDDSSSPPTSPPVSPSSSSSPSSAPIPSSSSSSYRSRLLIRQIRRSIETGDVDAAIHQLRLHVPTVLDDRRILFWLQKQKFIELLRRGTERDRDLAIECLRVALAPCALDAYPEAYEEFKHLLLALIFNKEDQNSPVAHEHPFMCSIHKVFCCRQGVPSPISDLTERLLLEDRDPSATPQESLYEAPPFDEVSNCLGYYFIF
ncbi:hypothetical protein GW17_00038248, partial [Ensete ventricosum]